ncbi:MAG: amidohydrolase family protein [Myxococcota bacterium]
MDRRRFLGWAAASAAGLALPSCGRDLVPGRYTQEDIDRLARQWRIEGERSGKGPFGEQHYRGYRGLAELPWFDLDPKGRLQCTARDLPPAIDLHCHFGMSLLLAPELDLFATSERVEHLLDCDGSEPGCDLDLDVYINRNFDEAALRDLRWGSVAQLLWGSSKARTQTLPNLLREMKATRVGQSLILPIAFGLPFGDDLTERWMAAIQASGETQHLLLAASVHPRDEDRIAKLRRYAAAGARAVKLHPPMQRFYPDEPMMMELYRECERLGMFVFFHCGRAGIEPESIQRYALPRHYEGAVQAFPNLRFVLGHSGARDVDEAIPIAERYENAWLGTHGQGVSVLDSMIRRMGAERMVFGTDWPFYHLAASLAKILIVTEGRPKERYALLRGNAEKLLGLSTL